MQRYRFVQPHSILENNFCFYYFLRNISFRDDCTLEIINFPHPGIGITIFPQGVAFFRPVHITVQTKIYSLVLLKDLVPINNFGSDINLSFAWFAYKICCHFFFVLNNNNTTISEIENGRRY